MSAFLELQQTGEIGEQTYTMLHDVAGGVVRTHNYPAPSGNEYWTKDEEWELVNEFLTGDRGLQRVITLFVKATDEHSLRNLAAAAIRNHLIDQFRNTDRGHLYQRLTDVIDDWDGLETFPTAAGPACRRVGAATDEIWSGTIRPLVMAAADVGDIRIERWRKAARRSPIADRESIARIIEAVLDQAEAAVLLSDLAEVMEARFALVRTPLVIELDDEPALEPSAADDTDREALTFTAAEEIFDQLSRKERILLAHYNDTLRELEPLLDVSKSHAGNLRNDLESKLKGMLASANDPEATLTELRTMAGTWTHECGISSHSTATD